LEQHIKYLQEKEGEKFSDFIKIHAAMLEENDTLKKNFQEMVEKNEILEKKVKEMEEEKLSHTEIVQEKSPPDSVVIVRESCPQNHTVENSSQNQVEYIIQENVGIVGENNANNYVVVSSF